MGVFWVYPHCGKDWESNKKGSNGGEKKNEKFNNQFELNLKFKINEGILGIPYPLYSNIYIGYTKITFIKFGGKENEFSVYFSQDSLGVSWV